MGLMGLMGLMGGWESAMGSAEIEFLTGWGKCFSGQGRKKNQVIGEKKGGKRGEEKKTKEKQDT